MIDPELKCNYCGSSNLREEIQYDTDYEGYEEVSVFCNLCNRKVL